MNIYSVIDDLNIQYLQENQRKSSSELLSDCFIRNYLLIRCYSNNKDTLIFSNFKKKIIAKYNAQISQFQSQKMKKTFYETKNILKKPNNIQKSVENNFVSNEYTQKYVAKKQYKIQSQPTLQTKIVKLKIRTQQNQKQFHQQALRNSQSKQQNQNQYRISNENSFKNKSIFHNNYNDTIQDSKFFQRTSLNMLIKQRKKKFLQQVLDTIRNNQQVKLQGHGNSDFFSTKKFSSRNSMKFLPNFIKKVKNNSYHKQKLFMSTTRMSPSASINAKTQSNKFNFKVAGNMFLVNHNKINSCPFEINSCTLQMNKSLTQSNENVPLKNSLKRMKIRKQTVKENLDLSNKESIHNNSTSKTFHNNSTSNICHNLSLKSFLFSKLN